MPTQLAAIEELKRLSFDSLFTDNDRASKYLLLAPFKRRYLCVFEEGVSTYYSSYLYEMKGLKQLKWRLSSIIRGSGFRFGEGRKTDLVFVTLPGTYARLNPRQAHKVRHCAGLIGEVRRHWDSWCAVLRPSLERLASGPAALVLGTWGGGAISRERLAQLKALHGTLVFKPHPHDGRSWADRDILVLDQPWVPAEVWVRLLADRFDQLTVYHYSSTTELYCLDLLERVRFVDLKGDVHIRRVCDLAVEEVATEPSERERLSADQPA